MEKGVFASWDASICVIRHFPKYSPNASKGIRRAEISEKLWILL